MLLDLIKVIAIATFVLVLWWVISGAWTAPTPITNSLSPMMLLTRSPIETMPRKARPGRLLLTSRQDPNAASCSAFLGAGHHPVTPRSLSPEILEPVPRQRRAR